MHRKQLFGISFVFIFFLTNMWAADVFNVTELPIKRADTFDAYIRTDHREKISTEKPKMILLGDSGISQLDGQVFSEITGKDTSVFSFPGTGSAYWFLFMRNQLFLAEHHPAYLVMFFRDTTLTVPNYRVHGEYFIRLEEIAASWDEDVYALAANDNKSSFVQFLERYIPLFAYRMEIYNNFIQWSRDYLPSLVMHTAGEDVDLAYQQVFGRQQVNDLMWEELLLNKDESLYTSAALNFSESVVSSFLPAMMRDLKIMGIQPVFARIKYRSHAIGEKDDVYLSSYLDSLERYINANGGFYIDLSKEDALCADMYEDNFHIDARYSAASSEIIARSLVQILDAEN